MVKTKEGHVPLLGLKFALKDWHRFSDAWIAAKVSPLLHPKASHDHWPFLVRGVSPWANRPNLGVKHFVWRLNSRFNRKTAVKHYYKIGGTN